MTILYLFRRDLRIQDNIALNYVLQYIDANVKNVIPCFIFTPEQVTAKNKYRSLHAIQFMIESLRELDQELQVCNSRLHYFQGDNIFVLNEIHKILPITHIVFARDYTPYAIQRDSKISLWCEKNDIVCHSEEDYLLANMGTFLKHDNTPYQIFTPFKNNALELENQIPKPSNKIRSLSTILHRTNALKSLECGLLYEDIDHPQQMIHGGRKGALKMLRKSETLSTYNQNRNCLTYQSSHMSAYIKFGCVSIREVYWKWRKVHGKPNGLIGQLLWREFYYYIIYYYKHVLEGQSFQKKYENLKWERNDKYWKAWKSGSTGFPIVDASIRQMITTGYMSNRSRLITSNFLVRILDQDWRIGEQFFATMLTDYDPAVNNGNWQWISSIGVDPKPHFQRLFNPWNQGKDYDPDAKFIKLWLPELKDIPSEELHEWDKHYHKYKKTYTKPIVDYKKQRALSLKKYKT